MPEHLRRENFDKLSPEDRHRYDQARQTAYITYQYEKEQRRKKYLGWYWGLKEKYRDKGPYRY